MAEAVPGPPRHPRDAHIDRPFVWIASFPKSGNTWTRVLLANFLGEDAGSGGDSDDDEIATIGRIASDRDIFDSVTSLTSSDLTHDEADLLRPFVYREIAKSTRRAPIFMKVHDAWHRNSTGEGLFPADCSRAAILLVRHPMDVCVSFAYHQGHTDFDRSAARMGSPDHALARSSYRQMRQHTFGWSGHYLSWTRQDEIPVLVVRYEDLLADTCAALERIVRFLGLDGADDRARIENAVEQSRFDRLREIEDRSGFQEVPLVAERFFRSGRSGEGFERLPPEIRARLASDHAAVMAELGYSPGDAQSLCSATDQEDPK